jgi:hypothetical protein
VGNTLRAVVDVGNLYNDFPVARNSCATASNTRSIYNGFDSNNNGVAGNNIASLCWALGYANGVIVRQESDNTCPEPHTASTDGTAWSTDYVQSNGYGAEYRCVGFR